MNHKISSQKYGAMVYMVYVTNYDYISIASYSVTI